MNKETENTQGLQQSNIGESIDDLVLSAPKNLGGLQSDKNQGDICDLTNMQNVTDLLWDVIRTSAKKSRIDDFTKENFEHYMATIYMMNRIQVDEEKFGDELIEKWQVPDIFENLVFPAEVTISAGVDQPNLIERRVLFQRPDQITKFSDFMSRRSFEGFSNILASSLQMSQLPSKSLRSLLQRKDFNEVADKLVQEDKVHWTLGTKSKFYWFSNKEVKFWNQNECVTPIAEYIAYQFELEWKHLRNTKGVGKSSEA